jgi:hypothetical protein
MSEPVKLAYSMDQILESPYVLGCRKQDKYKVIDVEIPPDWEFPAVLFPENNVIFVNQGNAAGFYMLFTETKAFSDIYHLLMETVKYNQEMEEKLVMLNRHQATLQKLFNELDLEDFRSLKMMYGGVRGVNTLSEKPVPPPSQIIKEGKEPINTQTLKTDANGTVFKP